VYNPFAQPPQGQPPQAQQPTFAAPPPPPVYQQPPQAPPQFAQQAPVYQPGAVQQFAAPPQAQPAFNPNPYGNIQPPPPPPLPALDQVPDFGTAMPYLPREAEFSATFQLCAIKPKWAYKRGRYVYQCHLLAVTSTTPLIVAGGTYIYELDINVQELGKKSMEEGKMKRFSAAIAAALGAANSPKVLEETFGKVVSMDDNFKTVGVFVLCQASRAKESNQYVNHAWSPAPKA
jgi:hypothetical protein